jgi:hypothetical protein
MPVTLNRRELHRLARVGAQARLEQLERERALILKAFPGLEAGMPASFPARTAPGARKRRRRGMSAAQRKAVSVRMRKYWAARRKAKAAK